MESVSFFFNDALCLKYGLNDILNSFILTIYFRFSDSLITKIKSIKNQTNLYLYLKKFTF